MHSRPRGFVLIELLAMVTVSMLLTFLVTHLLLSSRRVLDELRSRTDRRAVMNDLSATLQHDLLAADGWSWKIDAAGGERLVLGSSALRAEPHCTYRVRQGGVTRELGGHSREFARADLSIRLELSFDDRRPALKLRMAEPPAARGGPPAETVLILVLRPGTEGGE